MVTYDSSQFRIASEVLIQWITICNTYKKLKFYLRNIRFLIRYTFFYVFNLVRPYDIY